MAGPLAHHSGYPAPGRAAGQQDREAYREGLDSGAGWRLLPGLSRHGKGGGPGLSRSRLYQALALAGELAVGEAAEAAETSTRTEGYRENLDADWVLRSAPICGIILSIGWNGQRYSQELWIGGS